MSGVKRYTFDIDERYLCDCGNGDRVIRVESGKDGYVTASDYDRLEQECVRLRSVYEEDTRRLTGVNALADDLKTERDELRAQVLAMRADAERYRWIRDTLRHDDKRWSGAGAWNHANIPPAEFDAAIDAALQAKP